MTVRELQQILIKNDLAGENIKVLLYVENDMPIELKWIDGNEYLNLADNFWYLVDADDYFELDENENMIAKNENVFCNDEIFWECEAVFFDSTFYELCIKYPS